ncbi:MAG: hypothetical protein ACREXU_13260 [Gammaproteobacteria bacterium]
MANALTLTVRMSARYHSLRERWFLMLNELVTFGNVFLGSSVVALLALRGPRAGRRDRARHRLPVPP